MATKMMRLRVNGEIREVMVEPEKPLLWVLREDLQLAGTKFGCGLAQCGACTVHMDGEAVRSCVTPVERAIGKKVVTIEGLAAEHGRSLQEAWIEVQVPQCGYCQTGQIMSAAVLLANNPHPSDAEIDRVMAGNICRCGTYDRIRRAIHRAADAMGRKS
jgi:aerobic-type carbon monoxide dehydrogenase small subunit (CoxS/CutS family)